MTEPLTTRETLRLEALHSYGILDTEAEPAFDRISSLAARLFAMPIATICFLDDRRQWFKSRVGIDLVEAPKAGAFCELVVDTALPLVVDDAHVDERFSALPLVSEPPRVRFYAGAPIFSAHGYPLGTLAVMDVQPRSLEAHQVAALEELASMVSDQLDARSISRAKRLLDKITGTSPDVIYLFDLELGRTVYRSCESNMVPGYDLDERAGAPHALHIHQEDRARVHQHLLDVRAASDGERKQLSYRVGHDALGYIWLLANEAVFERDAQGHPKLLLGVASDITELKEAQEQLARLAVTDEMTGLPNLRALHERLALMLAEADRGRSFALVMLDVDHFKMINDAYGHKVGDEALVRVGQCLREHVRATDLVSRYGGEEFCVLFSDVDELTAVALAEKLRAALEATHDPVHVTASFGVCASTWHGFAEIERTADSMIRVADDALYRAKRSGRNRVEIAHSGITTGIMTRPTDAEFAQARAAQATGGTPPRKRILEVFRRLSARR
jgi:diguanylate cyclase (GGDEF)-like protein/PAS domain S-box-containing protein